MSKFEYITPRAYLPEAVWQIYNKMRKRKSQSRMVRELYGESVRKKHEEELKWQQFLKKYDLFQVDEN